MDGQSAAKLLRARVPEGTIVEVEDDRLMAFVRLDMLHLDADALHDRLAHWAQGDLARACPHAGATLSFRHASPAAPEEASTLDIQERWLGLEPTLFLDLQGAQPDDVERFAAQLPRFLELIEKEGRPPGFRQPEVGTME